MQLGCSIRVRLRHDAGNAAGHPPTHPSSHPPSCRQVYDITRHVLEHPGWSSGCGTSQLLAILRTLGTDCTEEVLMVHSQRALAQFAPFMIGVLAEGDEQASGGDGGTGRKQ